MKSYDEEKIQEKIIAVMVQEDQLDAEEAWDISFHLLDWLYDLEQLVAFYGDPEKYSNKEVKWILTNFLVHAPNHLAAASKLYTGFPVSDVFGVNAIFEIDPDED